MEYISDVQAKQMILEVGRRMYQGGFVAANDGNISCKVGDNEIWATPTGVSKGFMTEDMLVKLDLDGNVLEGTHKPSSEIKMHLRVFKENPKVQGVVHAHPLTATAFACAGISLEEPVLMEGVLSLGCVPLVHFALPGTEEVPEAVAPYCREYNAVLLANHGWQTHRTGGRAESGGYLHLPEAVICFSGHISAIARIRKLMIEGHVRDFCESSL